jgi:UPF0755 protein
MNRLFRLLGLLGIVIVLLFSYLYYVWYVDEIVNIPEGEKIELYIPSNTTLLEFFNLLDEKEVLLNIDNFEIFAVLKRIKKIQAGRYILKSGMSCNEVAKMFVSGLQTPLKVAITPSRLPQDLALKLSNKLELDSITIINALLSDSLASVYGFSKLDFYTLFIPDSYEIYWNISMEKLLYKMKVEYDKFWNEDRLNKANNIGLNPKEVVVLASIVYTEQSQFSDERPRIAGLYLNRLRIGMALQSDPTLIFGLGDFSRNRVLNKDKNVDSPYNTYKYTGLPPGPIYSPDKKSIEAVLNPEDNTYLYMCAKSDFSGYHAFAENLSQHNINARQYQRALNKARIYR